MVRTKADGAVRVAAGGKAPKKSMNYPQHNLLRSPSEKGKDNLPVNRYFPRETPAWQKKITCFYERHVEIPESSDSIKENNLELKQNNRNLKRSNSVLDDNDIDDNESSLKKIKISNDMQSHLDSKQTLNGPNDPIQKESMDMDE